MMFRVGEPLECVRAPLHSGGCLQNGQIYKCVSATDEDGCIRVDCCEHHQNPMLGWFASRFRPIARKTNISVFTAMLTPAGKKERSNAQS